MRLMVKYDDHHTVYFGHQHNSINIFCDTCYKTHDILRSLFSSFSSFFFFGTTHTDHQTRYHQRCSVSSQSESVNMMKNPIDTRSLLKLDATFVQIKSKSDYLHFQHFLHFLTIWKFQPNKIFNTSLSLYMQSKIYWEEQKRKKKSTTNCQYRCKWMESEHVIFSINKMPITDSIRSWKKKEKNHSFFSRCSPNQCTMSTSCKKKWILHGNRRFILSCQWFTFLLWDFVYAYQSSVCLLCHS